MGLILNRSGVGFNAEERNKTNDNWTMLETETNGLTSKIEQVDTDTNTRIDGVVIEAGTEAFNQVVDEAKLIWLGKVATFADLATTYPTPIDGNASMASDTGIVYRYDGSGWLDIQQIDAGPVNELDTRLSAELAENTNRHNSELINVMYPPPPLVGAVGDGVTDDTIAIQNIINHVNSLTYGGTVYFPNAEYLISATLETYPGVRLLGESRGYIQKGQGALIKLANGANVSMLHVNDTLGATEGGGIQGLNFNGNNLNNTIGHGLVIDGSILSIQNVSIRAVAQKGVLLNYSYTVFDTVYISKTGEECIYLDGHPDTEFRNCQFQNPDDFDTGVFSCVYLANAQQVRIDNCQMGMDNSTGKHGIEVGAGVFRLTITNCRIQNNEVDAIHIDGGAEVIISHTNLFDNGRNCITYLSGSFLVVSGSTLRNGSVGTGYCIAVGDGVTIPNSLNAIGNNAILASGAGVYNILSGTNITLQDQGRSFAQGTSTVTVTGGVGTLGSINHKIEGLTPVIAPSTTSTDVTNVVARKVGNATFELYVEASTDGVKTIHWQASKIITD